jgi:superfamily II DNA or RNA helicase
MKVNYFASMKPNIADNSKLRIPQREGYLSIIQHYSQPDHFREVGIVLPVGCGKSGLITLAPFTIGANRALVIAPGLRIKNQLAEDFDVSNPKMFYQKCNVVEGKLPEVSIIEGKNTNISDLKNSDVVITNIQQIQGDNNKWLIQLPADFFDIIVIDEAHHNIASSWERVRDHFSAAKILNLSATPERADGKIMRGEIIYAFSIIRAIENGYVKRLKAKVLNPATLRYIRNENGQEIKVDIEEIRRLGEEDSTFRRGIVSSSETLNTIIDCSIRELNALRERTGDNRHKIIASALSHAHCIQITKAYKARNLRAEYIHSQEDSATNEKILKKLENHQLDVIVQVKMLGEGFDHPYLSIAAVCSVFSNLCPFVQFIGRIMRVVDQNSISSLNNQGVVIFHAGSNIARRWQDFQSYSEADQQFFDELLPMEGLNFANASEMEIIPGRNIQNLEKVDIVEQEEVHIEELDLYKDNAEVQNAISILKSNGLDVILKPMQVNKQKQRIASQKALDEKVRNYSARILNEHNINPGRKELDKKTHQRTNFVYVKSLIDKEINNFIGIKSGKRGELSLEQIEISENGLVQIVSKIEEEIFNGES